MNTDTILYRHVKNVHLARKEVKSTERALLRELVTLSGQARDEFNKNSEIEVHQIDTTFTYENVEPASIIRITIKLGGLKVKNLNTALPPMQFNSLSSAIVLDIARQFEDVYLQIAGNLTYCILNMFVDPRYLKGNVGIVW